VPPAEVCGNSLDDNCDGATDEGCIDNDTCATPAPLAPGAPASGDTSTATDNSHASCHSEGAPDVYYEFTLDETSDVFLHTVPSGFDSVLYAGTTCGGADLGCNDDIYRAYVQASSLELHDLAAGSYYVTVDGYRTGEAGTYGLSMYATPAGTDGDDCGAPILIARPSTGTSTAVSGDTCTMTGQTEGSCGGLGAEAVFYFALRTARTVTFSTCNAATTGSVVLYVRSICDDDGSELRCSNGTISPTPCATNPTASLLSVALEPGLYFLYVDTVEDSSLVCGAFRVDVTGMF
jgi:hypothetical protein